MVDSVLSRRIDDFLRGSAPGEREYERSLRTAAAMLAQSPASMISSTTVVGRVGTAGEAGIREALERIDYDFDLSSTVNFRDGWFSARLARVEK